MLVKTRLLVSKKELPPCRGFRFGQTLQGLAEGFLCFVMLEAVALVEPVGALADHIRADGHAFTAVFASPILCRGQELTAGAKAPVPLRDDKTVNFRAKIGFQERLLTHVDPAYDPSDLCFGYKEGVLRRGPDAAKPLANLRRCCRIAELARQLCEARRVSGFRKPNFQLLPFSVRLHCFARAFRRSLDSTAGLFSSRSASAAIHRADRESCRRLLSAARIASRFSLRFLLPMFRKAQLTAFRTKFRSSYASRSITRKTPTNLASGAAWSL